MAGAATTGGVATIPGVGRLEPKHRVGEQAARIFDEEMEVVRHQAEGVNAEAVVEAARGERREEDEAIERRIEEGGAIDTAIRDVVEAIDEDVGRPRTISRKTRHAPMVEASDREVASGRAQDCPGARGARVQVFRRPCSRLSRPYGSSRMTERRAVPSPFRTDARKSARRF